MSDEPETAERDAGRSGRAIRDTTRNLIQSILLDVWPRSGAVVDFGLNTQEHYEALYYPLRHGDITPEQVDAALGKGKMLTELVNSAPHNPHKGIEFRTSWDELTLEPPDQPDGGAPSLSEIAASPASPQPEAAVARCKDDGFEL
jgi:hypothetical protein